MSEPRQKLPEIPSYTVQREPVLQLWVVLESGFPLAYCTDQASALFVAQACTGQRVASCSRPPAAPRAN